MSETLKDRPGFRAAVILCLVATLAGGVSATRAAADPLDRKLEAREEQLRQTREQEGVLTTTIAQTGARLDRLRSEVADLRNREASIVLELEEAQAELDDARDRLALIRQRLRRSIGVLRERLVAIYKFGDPGDLTVLLEATGVDDLATRYEYLGAIQARDGDIVDNVRDLASEAEAVVDEVAEHRDAIAARRAELAATRRQLASRGQELGAAQADQRSELATVRAQGVHLETGVEKLQERIRAQLLAAQRARELAAEEAAEAEEAAGAEEAAPAAPAPAAPAAGPVQSASSSGMVWPVEGALTSGFGTRWGRLHAGIDISAPEGTPIVAARAGTIVLSQSESESGGYGNYTCIDHGDGLSTCYAHQSSFELTSGSVEQGSVIGYVGNTGNSVGDHLHFEVRVDGEPVDPLGYL